MNLEALKEELRTVGLATLFFLGCFLLVIVLKKLFLAQYDIGFYGLSVAILGALLAGKVAVILDKLKAGTRFEESRPPWLSVAYKTLIYSIAAMVLVAAEKVFHAYRELDSLGPAIHEVWHGRDRNTIFATALCLAAAFGAYNVLSVVNRHLAGGRLGAWFMGRATVGLDEN